MSPVRRPAGATPDLCVQNAGIREYSACTQARLDVFRCDFPLRDGCRYPGHGIGLDEDPAAPLPVDRPDGGTLRHR